MANPVAAERVGEVAAKSAELADRPGRRRCPGGVSASGEFSGAFLCAHLPPPFRHSDLWRDPARPQAASVAPRCLAVRFDGDDSVPVLSVFPIIDVASWQIFAAKIIVVIVGANLLGAVIYFARHGKIVAAKA